MATQELYNLAKAFVERATALNLKGKKRDDAALEFIIGAIHGARLAGNEQLAKHFERVAVMLISVRGYSEYVRIVSEHEKATHTTIAA